MIEVGTVVKMSFLYESPYDNITIKKGSIGKVLKYTQDKMKIGIEFNNPLPGNLSSYNNYNCHKTGKSGHSMYIPIEYLEVVKHDSLPMSDRFPIGSRVVVNNEKEKIHHTAIHKGMLGTVIKSNYNAGISVQFDKDHKHFHSCKGHGEKYHCWMMDAESLDLVEDITQDSERVKVHEYPMTMDEAFDVCEPVKERVMPMLACIKFI